MVDEKFAAQVVDMLQALFNGSPLAVHGVGVDALRAAFGAGAVIAGDVEDDRVFSVSFRLDIREQPADFIIRLRQEGGVDFHFVRQQFLLVRVQRIPGRHLFRPRRKLGIGRDDPKLLLAGVGLFAKFVPSLVELARILLDPHLGHVVGSVCGAGGEV